MLSVTFSCPECGSLRRESMEGQQALECADCHHGLPRSVPRYTPAGDLEQCVVCTSKELFIRKDFPQRLGVLIVSIGFVVSCYFWARYNILLAFGVLFATALVDVVLYFSIGNVLECYRCHAQYRGLKSLEGYGAFDMEAYEKHRQQAIRLKESQQASN